MMAEKPSPAKCSCWSLPPAKKTEARLRFGLMVMISPQQAHPLAVGGIARAAHAQRLSRLPHTSPSSPIMRRTSPPSNQPICSSRTAVFRKPIIPCWWPIRLQTLRILRKPCFRPIADSFKWLQRLSPSLIPAHPFIRWMPALCGALKPLPDRRQLRSSAAKPTCCKTFSACPMMARALPRLILTPSCRRLVLDGSLFRVALNQSTNRCLARSRRFLPSRLPCLSRSCAV